MEQVASIRPWNHYGRAAAEWSSFPALAFVPLGGAIVLGWLGILDWIAVPIAAILIPPLFETLVGDARGIRMAVGEAFPAPPKPPDEDEIEMLAMSMSWAAGATGCPWPLALPPGRHLIGRAGDEPEA